ncbi:hypothetical protein PSPO_a0862 [Pseudoalteromonas spongiae UST010723-006]|nr:hypothetical protein PSPO_a0862 [Pseudoalteromonas spongiae UST010723-006]
MQKICFICDTFKHIDITKIKQKKCHFEVAFSKSIEKLK